MKATKADRFQTKTEKALFVAMRITGDEELSIMALFCQNAIFCRRNSLLTSVVHTVEPSFSRPVEKQQNNSKTGETVFCLSPSDFLFFGGVHCFRDNCNK